MKLSSQLFFREQKAIKDLERKKKLSKAKIENSKKKN
jgi:hypothetical protein